LLSAQRTTAQQLTTLAAWNLRALQRNQGL